MFDESGGEGITQCVCSNDQGVRRGQINRNLILNADDTETYSLIRSQRVF
jgi:hypothetical protein